MRVAFCVLLLSPWCAGAEPVPAIRLPISQQAVVPTAVTELRDAESFVIAADIECLVLASRDGFVTITRESGPLKFRAVFSDGNGKPETRTYDAKHLWIIEAKVAGEVELLIVPRDAVDESDVIRRTLIVSGSGPRPPPGPTPPQPSPVDRKLSLVVVHDVRAITPAAAIVLNSTAVWNEATAAGSDWIFYDITSTELAAAKARIDMGGLTAPVLIVYDRATREKLVAVPLPKSVEELRSISAKYGGAKP